MGAVAGSLDLLDHEPPAGRTFNGELGLTVDELSQPRTHLGPRRWCNPTAPQLTRIAVERLVGDLLSMHIQRHYDPHRDLLELRHKRHRVTTTHETRGTHYMSSLYERGGHRRGAGVIPRSRCRSRRFRGDPAGPGVQAEGDVRGWGAIVGLPVSR